MRLRPAGEPYNRKTLSKVKRSGVRAQVGAGPGRGRGQPRSRPEGLRPPRCTHPGVQSGAGEVGILHSLPFTPPLQVPHLPSLPRPGEPLLGIPPSTRGFGPDISASSALSLLPGAPRACCVPSSLSPRRPWLLRAPSRSPPCRPWPSRAAPRTWARRRWCSSACATSRGWSSSSIPSATCWLKHRPTAAAGDCPSLGRPLLQEPSTGAELPPRELSPGLQVLGVGGR